ncbi:hypothetical protein [uncultured Granulicatella sp.]|uniref:hypothetical protein n=1 Tax=uncultured Granulicatella sp. TaxID=316089 RepID=UPI0028D35154|nr:hypothetical protein [uncultured Granulicatella sp.]
MEFTDFANKLRSILSDGGNTIIFTKSLFEILMNDEGIEELNKKKDSTIKAYFNGGTSLKKFSSVVLAHLNDDDEFERYINEFGDTTLQLLVDEFSNEIPDIGISNAGRKLYELFLEILKNASNKKSTQKSAQNSNKKLTNPSIKEEIVHLPKEQESKDIPYSDEDQLLLAEFTSDYDAIMSTIIGENFASAFLEMKITEKIKELYQLKWQINANKFDNPTLKGYIFNLLGELNKISDIFFSSTSTSSNFKKVKSTIRNLYVKLHPELYTVTFPYEAFIDDWNDGEIY